MYPEKTSSYITVLPTTQSEIYTFIEQFRAEMSSGYIEATKVAIQLKAMEELIKQLRADPIIRDLIMEEVDKHPEKVFEIQGAKFEKSETGVKYDFTGCNSSVWNDLNDKRKKIDESVKEEEKRLKSLLFNENIEAYDKNTGEKINPPSKTSNTYVKIILKK